MNPEDRGRDFLDYVAAHGERLRSNLAKNITFDHDLFEDAFGDAVISVYDAIVKRKVKVGNFENFFFQASRRAYNRAIRNKERHSGNKEKLELLSDPTPEISLDSSPLAETEKKIREIFGEAEAELFIDYFESKIRGRVSYKAFAIERGIKITSVAETVGKIKRFLRDGLHKETQEERPEDS